jgi:hypothetical protein
LLVNLVNLFAGVAVLAPDFENRLGFVGNTSGLAEKAHQVHHFALTNWQ